MVGAPYTFAKYFLKGTRDQTEFLPSLDTSPGLHLLHRACPPQDDGLSPFSLPPQEHREPEHPCLHADDTQT